MSEAKKAAALKFLEAMSAGDAETQGALLTEDAYTDTKGFAGVSGRRDRATMLATVAAFNDILPSGFNETIHRVVADGDTVVVEWEGNATLSNGEPYANQYVFVFGFTGDKISSLHEYFCTAYADRTILPLLAEQSAEMAHGNG